MMQVWGVKGREEGKAVRGISISNIQHGMSNVEGKGEGGEG
jgi:hypothetical protein